MNVKISAAFAVAVLAVLYYYNLLFLTFTIFAHVIVGGLGIYLGVSLTLVRGKQYTPPPIPQELLHPRANLVLQNMMEARTGQKPGPKKVVISRNMDLILQEVIDLLLRDYVCSWYKGLSRDQEALLSFLQTDLWEVIENMSNKLSKVDWVRFITQDVVSRLQDHFQNIRLATKKNPSDGVSQSFKLHFWLKSEEEELEFLRKVSEALLIVILPKSHAKSAPIRRLLREVAASAILKPTIDMICDPDYINTKLISYIEYREKLSEDTRRTYTYAATYEDFVKMIEKCEDIEHLKQLRFNIMTEIMQATTIDNLKKTSAMDKDKDKQGSPKSNKTAAKPKGELLKARNLKRYINQLTVAKSRCEKRIFQLGGPDYKYYSEDKLDTDRRSSVLPDLKVLTFDKVMESQTAREYFETYLKRDDNESLIGFWNAVERLKEAEKSQHHQLAAEIYQRYISSSTSVVKIDKSVARRMEAFMLGNTGPEAFFEAQQHVATVLKKQHYPSFLVSDVCHKYITTLEEDVPDGLEATNKDELFFEPKEGSDEENGGEMFATQSYHAQQKLQQLDSKITNKSQALQALKTSRKADPKETKTATRAQMCSKISEIECFTWELAALEQDSHKDKLKMCMKKIEKVEEELEREVESMVIEKRNLENHILRTQNWCENQGKWKAHIYEAETAMEGDKKIPIFVLVVHLAGGGGSQNLQKSTEGWVVTRKLQDFQAVHEKLVQIGPWLKKKELPTVKMFTTIDAKYLREAKTMLNDYLSVIMKDERMAMSEALYGFLTPTPEYFQQPTQEKKSSQFLKTILKSLPSISQDTKEIEDDLLFGGDDSAKDDRSKDSIAEPLYGLINEVYELHGMFRWLRKSFIAFVEVTFGRSINRQLRETVYWIFSEPMVIYYIRLFKDSMWPNGVLAEPLPHKSDEEKLRTRLKAKEKFLQNQPDAVKTLVGEENARRGTIKMFEVLQDIRLNKHLFYVFLQLLIVEMIPELGPAFSTLGESQEDSEKTLLISSSEIVQPS